MLTQPNDSGSGVQLMSSDLITFSQVVAKARTLDDDAAFGNNGTDPGGPSRPESVENGYQRPSDRALATRVSGARANLQEAMDTAVRAGLMVEPSFRPVGGRFNEFGVSIDSHICTVEIFRKLA